MITRLFLAEIKKKKTQTVSMILMLGFSLTFLIVSALFIYSSTILIKDFVDMSNIYSVVLWKSYDNQDEKKLQQLSKNEPYVSSLKSYDAVSLKGNDSMLCNGKAVGNISSYFLIANDEEYDKIYSVNKNEKIELSPGEIAIPLFIAKASHINIGDKINININNTPFNFTVKYIFKDALFGSEYISTKRLVIDENDMTDILKVCTPNRHNSLVGINLNSSAKVATLISALTEYKIPISFNVDKDLLMQVYGASNGIIAVMFLVVALFIGIISFFIQRYSIHTTIEDDYSHIGVMKALGFQDKQIIVLYLYRYLFIDICGLLVGVFLGAIFSTLFLSNSFDFVVVQSWLKVLSVPLLCIILVGIVYVIISYLYLLRISKLSPIEIKNKKTEDSRIPLISLGKSQIGFKIILAINDFTQNLSNYIKIIVALVFCFALFITINNFKGTISSDDFLKYFGLTVGNIYCDIHVDSFNTQEINETVAKLNKELKNNNEKVILGTDFYIDSRIIYAGGASAPITALKSATSTANFQYIKGKAPKNEHEIAITNVLAHRYGVDVGDTISLEVEGITSDYTITAINQALYNMGELILLSDDYHIKSQKVSSYRVIAFVEGQDKAATIAYLQSKYNFMKGPTGRELINSLTGGMVDQIVLTLNFLMIFILFFMVIVLSLFSRMLFFKDSFILKQLHSIGANNSRLLCYQLIKASIFIIISISLGIICAVTIGKLAVVKLFAMTGLAKFILNIQTVNSFIVIPIAFLILALLIIAITQGEFIKKQFLNKKTHPKIKDNSKP